LHTSLTARMCNLPAVGLSALHDGFVRYPVEWLIVLNWYGEVHNMKKTNKTFIGMTFLALALAVISAFVLMGRHSVSAATVSSASTTTQGGTMPPVFIFALTTDNTLYVLTPGSTVYQFLGRVAGIGGNDLIGIDFRPADKRLYALSDGGQLYTINFNVAPPTATLVSTLNTPRFPSGFQSLMDFNPVVDAIRLIGSDTLNYAVVKGANGILNTTAVQTAMTYAVGDVNAGKTPKVNGGAYTNNVAGATTTLFYAIDHDQDTLVTIADKNATGSSNTGGGRLQTIGRLVDVAGNQITVNPVSDIDIITLNGVNFLIGASRDITFQISLNQINPNLPLGTTQNVVVQGFLFPTNPAARSSFIDVAASTLQ
jgi:Domain of unknown function (DUF4394)